jgi:hypothetical protein
VADGYSLGELASYYRMASKACGMHWGLMEETGWSVRYLADLGLPGPQLLLSYAKSLKGRDITQDFPRVNTQPWSAPSGRLCPIASAASLTDRGEWLGTSEDKVLESVAFPLLMVGQIQLWVQQYRKPLQVSWENQDIVILKQGLSIRDTTNIASPFSPEVVVRLAENRPVTHRPRSCHYPLDHDSWSEVSALALETFVPASVESRSGAGAGLLDND